MVAPDPAWAAFAARHPAHPMLHHDPLYALDSSLLLLLQRMAPLFFDAAEAAFEKDLAATTGGGMFVHRRLQRCLLTVGPVQDANAKRADTLLRELLADQFREDGKDPASAVPDHLAETNRQRREAERRARAYVAWLVTHKPFLTERDSWKGRLGGWVTARGHFPSAPHSYLGETPASPGEDAGRGWGQPPPRDGPGGRPGR